MHRFLIAFCIAIVFVSCKKDEDPEPDMVQNHAPALAEGLKGLHFDTYNIDAPTLLTGTYEMGARFSGSKLNEVMGGRLVQIQYYMMEKPNSAQLRVYAEGSNVPAQMIYSANVLSEMERNKWNVHHVPDSVVINSNQLWITLFYQVSTEQKYLGCDPGPANANGDWMWLMADQNWERYESRSGTSINWNIRGVIDPE